MKRYTQEQVKVIEEYFEQLKWTRKTGKLSKSIKERELKYWEKFEPDVVVEALRTHIIKYPTMREEYTRGIMRNVDVQKKAKTEGTNVGKNNSGVNSTNGYYAQKTHGRNETAADAIRARLG